jgi:arylsulfatase A
MPARCCKSRLVRPLAAALLLFGLVAGAAAGRPNVVFILIDDLGWADVGCNGVAAHRTPNIDRLAAEGVRFTQAYAACAVCSPTRASILTGKYPARMHLTDWIPGEGDSPNNALRIPQWRQHLPFEETTLATTLRNAGYATAAIGKWHLGDSNHTPQHHGFDLNVAGGETGQPASYFWPYEGPAHTVPGLRAGGHPGEYLNDRLTDAAVEFIEGHKAGPFFLYLAHYAVHVPLEAKPGAADAWRARHKSPDGQTNAVYAAMVESVDESVGRILNALGSMGIDDRTIVVFTSDNGGLWPTSTSNAPLRAGKGFPYEGGLRVPCIVRQPGRIRSGAVCDTPVCSIDFNPTLLDLAGVSSPGFVDGVSLAPILTGSGNAPKRPLFWHYPHYWHGDWVRPYGVVRDGDWKLIEFYEDQRVELYDLKSDPGETRNLASNRTRKAASLRKSLEAWRRKVGAQMPTPNLQRPHGAANPRNGAFDLEAGED